MSLTDAQDQHVTFCDGVAFERELHLADPVEGEKTPPPASIGQLRQMTLRGLRDSRLEDADDCVSQRLRELRHHECADGKVPQGLHDGCLCHRGYDRPVLRRERHDRHRRPRARADDHALLTEGGSEVGAGFQGRHVAQTDRKPSYADSMDLLEERLPLAIRAAKITEQAVSVDLDVRERGHRVIDRPASRSLRKQGGGDSFAHAVAVSQMDDKASDALSLPIDDHLRKNHGDFGHIPKRSSRRHGFCRRCIGRMQVERSAVGRKRGRGLDVPSVKAMRNLCEHELSA